MVLLDMPQWYLTIEYNFFDLHDRFDSQRGTYTIADDLINYHRPINKYPNISKMCSTVYTQIDTFCSLYGMHLMLTC